MFICHEKRKYNAFNALSFISKYMYVMYIINYLLSINDIYDAQQNDDLKYLIIAIVCEQCVFGPTIHDRRC